MSKSSDIPEFGLLSGINVVHVSTSVAGPWAAQQYAENGANVIWIENPNIPCMTRNRYGGSWQVYMRNERNIALDIPSPEGREIFLKLMEKTDVFIEGSKGKHWDHWGLSDDVLWERNPRLVIVHISGFGQTGVDEYVERGSYDPIAQAFGCYMQLNGFPDTLPVPAMPMPIDHFCGYAAYGNSLAALIKAQKTGKGESIDIAQYEMAMRNQNDNPFDYYTAGVEKNREGNHSAVCAGYGLYSCGDGKSVYMLLLGGGSLRRVFPLLGLEYGSERFPATLTMVPAGTPAGDLLEEKLNEFCMQRTAKEVEEILLANQVACSKVMGYDDAINDPQYQAREVITEWDSVYGDKITGVNIFPKMKNSPGQIWRGAPTVGMDNEDILTELGVPEEEIKALYEKNIIAKKEQRPPLAYKK